MSFDIPNSPLTDSLRLAWKVRCEERGWQFESFEECYLRHVRGEGFGLRTSASLNGRALAALLFDRARMYWPEFYSPADLLAVALWGELLDLHPFLTPAIIEQTVDTVAASGVQADSPAHFLPIAEQILKAETA